MVANTIDENDLHPEFFIQINGFKKQSLTFLLLVIVSLSLSLFGMMYLFAFPVLIFALWPKIYKTNIVRKPANALLRAFSGNWGNRLSYIPGVNLKGRWFIEANSEVVQMKSFKEVLLFILRNWKDFILIPIGLFVLIVRTMLTLGLINISEGTSNYTDLLFSGNAFFIIVMIIPIFFLFYYPLVFTWEDAELKIANWKSSSRGDNFEIKKLFLSVDSLRNIVALFAGFSTLNWIVKLEESLGLENTDIFGAIGYAVATYLFIGGIVIFQGIMYYRSGIHQENVNHFRVEAYRNFKLSQEEKIDFNETVSILSTQIIPLNIEDLDNKS